MQFGHKERVKVGALGQFSGHFFFLNHISNVFRVLTNQAENTKKIELGTYSERQYFRERYGENEKFCQIV